MFHHARSRLRSTFASAALLIAVLWISESSAQVPNDSLVPTPPATPLAEESDFDAETLKMLGFNPAISQYFSKAARFNAGLQWVEVKINGQSTGQKKLMFDFEGRPCFTPDTVRSLGLLEMGDGGLGQGCPDYRTFAPRAIIQPQPGMAALEITVPLQYVMLMPRATNIQGGMGALLNYRAFFNRGGSVERQSPGFRYDYVNTLVGFNAADWTVRSTQDYSKSNGQSQWYWRSAYVQKVFEEQQQVLQAGRISLQDSLFGGVPIIGGQWFPERALRAQDASFAVTGQAATRARVEIRQNGILLFNTTVPPGPFSITDYPLHNRSSDLQITVLEETGAEQSFTVPATSLALSMQASQFAGWSIAAGRYWDQTGRDVFRQAPTAAISRGWSAGLWSGSAGSLLTSGYTALSLGINTASSTRQVNGTAQTLLSNDNRRGLRGMQSNLAAGSNFGKDIWASLSGSVRTAGFRPLQESLSYEQSISWGAYGYRSQVGLNLSWRAGIAGSLSAGLTRELYFQGAPGQIARLSWDKSWAGGTSLSIGFSRRSSRLSPLDALNPLNGDQRLPPSSFLYGTFTIPLEKNVSLRSFVQRIDGTDRFATGFEQRLNSQMAYRASYETVEGPAGRSQGGSLAANGVPYFTSLSAGISRIRDYDNVYLEASGGVVATGDGVALSPYAVQESFGTLRTGNVTGARIETPQGPVWSGLGALAALPALTPYQESRLELGGKSIPLDIEIENGLQTVQVSRGAVVRLKMNLMRVRRIMLTVTRADSTVLPAGTPVLREGEFLTTTGEGGRVLVTQFMPDDRWQAELPDGSRCEIGELKTQERKTGELFERALARCR